MCRGDEHDSEPPVGEHAPAAARQLTTAKEVWGLERKEGIAQAVEIPAKEELERRRCEGTVRLRQPEGRSPHDPQDQKRSPVSLRRTAVESILWAKVEEGRTGEKEAERGREEKGE